MSELPKKGAHPLFSFQPMPRARPTSTSLPASSTFSGDACSARERKQSWKRELVRQEGEGRKVEEQED